MSALTCVRCQADNSADSKYCKNCGLALTLEPFVGKLVPRDVPGMEEPVFIRTLPFSIGRARQCDLFLNLNSISRQHATIEKADGRLQLIDGGSVNGTFLNGTR